jgi:hypothetical protein
VKTFECTQGSGKGGTSYTPSKDFEKCGQQNAIKHKNRGPHNPKTPFKRKNRYVGM